LQRRTNNSNKAKFWILTLPSEAFVPYLPPSVCFIRGQLEQGAGGFKHWQVCAIFFTQVRLSHVRSVFGPYHAEPTKSVCAERYVWKEETRIAGTQFELGERPKV